MSSASEPFKHILVNYHRRACCGTTQDVEKAYTKDFTKQYYATMPAVDRWALRQDKPSSQNFVLLKSLHDSIAAVDASSTNIFIKDF